MIDLTKTPCLGLSCADTEAERTAADVMRAALAEYGIAADGGHDEVSSWLEVHGPDGAYAVIYVDTTEVEDPNLPDTCVDTSIDELGGSEWFVLTVGRDYAQNLLCTAPIETGATDCAEFIANWLTAPAA
ncbi:hypothetical protein [Kitasatospora aureofaciens]|uniref:hypothetical protein n=1 Tax=Kitasatospora aureofaciens TaxID=1894 RepID=UPI0033DDF408